MLWRLLTLRSVDAPDRRLLHVLAAAAITILGSMAFIAHTVSERLVSTAMLAAAEEGALLLDVFLGPSVQDLGTSGALSPDSVEKLDGVLKAQLSERMKAVKIWLRDGTLAYSSSKELIGTKFPSPRLDAAFGGEAAGYFNQLDEHSEIERWPGIPMIEIYAPLYRIGTREIIAVGEIYNDGEILAAAQRSIRFTSAGIVGGVTAPMMLILFLLAWRANSIAAQHEKSLVEKVSEARTFAAQNDQLRQMAEDARFDAMHSNERLLGQIGQDLHDGPIQLLSILTLKLSELLEESPVANAQERTHLANGVRHLSEGILAELRDISTGLVLPELEGLGAEETIWLAVHRHENTTGTSVECEISELAFEPSSPLRICMFRIVQEGLNNAFHHASGRGQRVAASLGDRRITIVVTDCGANESGEHCSGFRHGSHRRTGMGLPGLRRRVEAFNGSFEVSSEGNRTRVTAVIPVQCSDSNGRNALAAAARE